MQTSSYDTITFYPIFKTVLALFSDNSQECRKKEEEEGLHAVASCEVSVDEVLAAEVLHPSGNIGHKLHQHLWREVLKQTQALSYLFFSFPAEGSTAHVFEDCGQLS